MSNEYTLRSRYGTDVGAFNQQSIADGLIGEEQWHTDTYYITGTTSVGYYDEITCDGTCTRSWGACCWYCLLTCLVSCTKLRYAAHRLAPINVICRVQFWQSLLRLTQHRAVVLHWTGAVTRACALIHINCPLFCFIDSIDVRADKLSFCFYWHVNYMQWR